VPRGSVLSGGYLGAKPSLSPFETSLSSTNYNANGLKSVPISKASTPSALFNRLTTR
jgi:hypothetical protein